MHDSEAGGGGAVVALANPSPTACSLSCFTSFFSQVSAGPTILRTTYCLHWFHLAMIKIVPYFSVV